MTDFGHNGGPPLDGADNPFGRDGFIALARTLRDHPVVGVGKVVKPSDPARGFVYSRGEAWIDLIMECRYQDGTVMNRGRKMEIKPGQLLGAVSWLAHRWNWSPMGVRWFLNTLEKEGMIERPKPRIADTDLTTELPNGTYATSKHKKKGNKHPGNQVSVLTICKYALYQLSQRVSQQPQQQANNKHATSEQQESNKGTKEQEDSVPNGTGAASAPSLGGPSVPSVQSAVPERSIRDIVWQDGLGYLKRIYVNTPPDSLRQQLGKLVKDFGEGHVLNALAAAQKAAPLDPLNYAREILNSPTRGNRKPPTEEHWRDKRRRENEEFGQMLAAYRTQNPEVET